MNLKFDIGQKIYIIQDDGAELVEVVRVVFVKTPQYSKTSYTVASDDGVFCEVHDDSSMFHSLEDVIRHLLKHPNEKIQPVAVRFD